MVDKSKKDEKKKDEKDSKDNKGKPFQFPPKKK